MRLLSKQGFEVFDKVKASPELKEKTRQYLHSQAEGEQGIAIPAPRKRSRLPRVALALAAALVVALSGFGYYHYIAPIAYLDLDVNPSLSLQLNRAETVLRAAAYNDSGAEILAKVDVSGLPYDEAVQRLLGEMIAQGYLQRGGLVAATVQAANTSAEQRLLSGLDAAVSTTLHSHHAQAETDVFAVDESVRQSAAGYSISPAKYLAIEELLELDDNASFEGCVGHSLGEIRQLIRSCHEGGGQQHRHRHGHH